MSAAPVNQDKILYLVDGSSYIHRAYHAIKNLSNSKGIPTNAVFGFTKMILKLINEKCPAYLAVVLDARGKNFRHQIYQGYKASRPSMPEDLSEQIPYIRETLRHLRITLLEKDGYEADDIIGTLAARAEEIGFQAVVVSGDKDFRQIISPRVSMWDPMKDRVLDFEGIRREYGLEPLQLIDVMGLSGDSTDDIPGVPGIGEKTACMLIRQYGSIEGLYEHLEEVKQKRLKENLENSRSDAVLSRRLVAIDRGVPLDLDIGGLVVGEPDQDGLASIFRELEFKSLWEQFTVRKGSPDRDYSLCFTEEELRSIIDRIRRAGEVSVDTETTGRDPLNAELVGISLACSENCAYYLPLGHCYPGAPVQMKACEAFRLLKPVLEDETVAKIGQNIKYDALILRRNGIELKGIRFDTMVASYVINPGLKQHNLDYLAQHYLNHKMISYHALVGKGNREVCISAVDLDRTMEYACEDAETAFRLKSLLMEKLVEDGNRDLFYELEMRLVPVLMDMEWRGIRVDTEFFRAMSARLSEQLNLIEQDIYREAGMEFNINSPRQLGFVLFDKLRLPAQKKTSKTKAYSTDVKVLERLCLLPYRLPGLLLRYRTLSKLKSTYLDALVDIVNPSTGRVHTSFNQTVTATGRLSSSNPNLQNIPIRSDEGRELRKGFIADEGCYLLSADYSQVELRIFAHYSGDGAFIDAFRKNEDIHARTASEIMGIPLTAVTPEMRRVAKAINFGIIYGMGSQKLSDQLGIPKKAAADYIDAYYRRYKGVFEYRREMVSRARQRGYVTTLFNRRRYLPGINHGKQYIRAEAERMAVNTPIQGTAADLIKKAMIRIYTRLQDEGLKAGMLLQVHDELLFEVPENEIDVVSGLVREEMEGVYRLDVPLKVEIGTGRNWEEAH